MITINVTRDELHRLARSAVSDIDTDDNYVDGQVGPDAWTAEGLTEARAEVLALYDRAIELVRAWEEAED